MTLIESIDAYIDIDCQDIFVEDITHLEDIHKYIISAVNTVLGSNWAKTVEDAEDSMVFMDDDELCDVHYHLTLLFGV